MLFYVPFTYFLSPPPGLGRGGGQEAETAVSGPEGEQKLSKKEYNVPFLAKDPLAAICCWKGKSYL